MIRRFEMYAMVCAVVCALAWTGMAPGATTVGEQGDVAPEVEGSVFQKWPHAAWSAEASCWLVVWREGEYNKQETDIWCARVSAEGKTLDPAGVRITTAKDIQDRPVVVSDGKDFLVLWQDLRSAADGESGDPPSWDVYAARVSADGTVKDPDGFPVVAGPHNQVFPSVVFAGQHYYVVWQSWVEDAVAEEFGSYGVRGARISSDGKVLDVEGIDLVPATALQPAVAYHPEGGLVVVCTGRSKEGTAFSGGYPNYPIFLRLDPEKGTPQGEPQYVPRNQEIWDRQFPPGVVLLKDGSCMVNMVGYSGGMTLFKFDEKGTRTGDWVRFRKSNKNGHMVTVPSMATDGESILMTLDFPSAKESSADAKGLPCMKIWGWKLSPDGTIREGGKSGFPIAMKDGINCVQNAPCAGPEGTFLVVYGEMRGMKETKIVGALVK